MTTLSIVIPAYNEERRIGPTLRSIEAFLSSRSRDAEIIVVDDGSRDATVEVVVTSGCSNLQVIRVERNRGKGSAVRLGMLAASGDRRLFMDADGSTPVSELDRLEAGLEEIGGSGIAFASIAVPGADVLSAQSGLRTTAGRIGNRMIRMIALPGVKDSQRGFKLFSAEAAEAIFSRCVVDGWGFDVEALALAKRLGFESVEVPITWSHMEDSSVTSLSYLATLTEVLGVRWRLLRGGYETAEGAVRRGQLSPAKTATSESPRRMPAPGVSTQGTAILAPMSPWVQPVSDFGNPPHSRERPLASAPRRRRDTP
jgi:dolichyl-phosphate beta-glucosyltransferase